MSLTTAVSKILEQLYLQAHENCICNLQSLAFEFRIMNEAQTIGIAHLRHTTKHNATNITTNVTSSRCCDGLKSRVSHY